MNGKITIENLIHRERSHCCDQQILCDIDEIEKSHIKITIYHSNIIKCYSNTLEVILNEWYLVNNKNESYIMFMIVKEYTEKW